MNVYTPGCYSNVIILITQTAELYNQWAG